MRLSALRSDARRERRAVSSQDARRAIAHGQDVGRGHSAQAQPLSVRLAYHIAQSVVSAVLAHREWVAERAAILRRSP